MSLDIGVFNFTGDSTTFRAHQCNIRTVDFSPDGQQLVSGSDDKSIKIWTVHRHKFVCSLTTHTNWVCLWSWVLLMVRMK